MPLGTIFISLHLFFSNLKLSKFEKYKIKSETIQHNQQLLHLEGKGMQGAPRYPSILICVALQVWPCAVFITKTCTVAQLSLLLGHPDGALLSYQIAVNGCGAGSSFPSKKSERSLQMKLLWFLWIILAFLHLMNAPWLWRVGWGKCWRERESRFPQVRKLLTWNSTSLDLLKWTIGKHSFKTWGSWLSSWLSQLGCLGTPLSCSIVS